MLSDVYLNLDTLFNLLYRHHGANEASTSGPAPSSCTVHHQTTTSPCPPSLIMPLLGPNHEQSPCPSAPLSFGPRSWPSPSSSSPSWSFLALSPWSSPAPRSASLPTRLLLLLLPAICMVSVAGAAPGMISGSSPSSPLVAVAIRTIVMAAGIHPASPPQRRGAPIALRRI